MSVELARSIVGDDSTKAAIAYVTRASGLPWSEVGYDKRSLRVVAATRGWPWPPPCPSPGRTVNAAPADDKKGERCYVLRTEDKTWVEIGEIVGVSNSRAQFLANRWAARHGKPNPERPPKVKPPNQRDLWREAQRQAWELRKARHTWPQIVELIPAYSCVPHAVKGARIYAEREGKEWPVKLEGRK